MTAVEKGPFVGLAGKADVDFWRLLDVLPAAAYTCDPEGLITYYNRRAVQAWGREPKLNDPADRYCGSFRMSNADGEWVPHDRCWMALCLQERRAFEGEEIVVERPDGTRLVVLAHAIPMFDPQGALLGAVNVVVDITSRKRTEDQLQQSENALRAASERKDEFLATLAHELRNPLAPIRNALHLLRLARSADNPTTALAPVHEMLERQINHLVHLVDDLMDVSRITRDRIELRRELVDVASVVDAAVESAKPLIERRKHQLSIAVPADPLLLDADPVRLTQVLANLLNNAAKYTEPGGHVWLSARREDSQLVLSVRDTGVGIPADMMPKVFDLFTQVDDTYGRKLGGLGIGLTLVKRLVEMHDGEVEVRSEGEGRGSEFIVRLPLSASALPASGKPATQSAPLLQQRILVVDDNQDGANSLAELLRYHGADVVVAHDGHRALEALQTFRPAFALVDIGMPEMDGYELARRARALNGDLTIIALTGWGQEKDRRLSKEAGIDHHLIKPVDFQILLSLLTKRER